MKQSHHSARRIDCRRLLVGLTLVAIAVGLVAVWQSRSRAEIQGATAVDRQIVRITQGLTVQKHLSRHLLDDEISQRSLKTFLKGLDPMKVYFYQGDVDEFMSHRNQIDDMVKRGDISLAYTIFQRFLQRVDERTALIDELLERQYDFQVDEDIITDPDVLSFPQNQAEAQERWRKRIKYELLRQKANEVEPEGAVAKVRRRYRSINRQWHQTDDDELLQMFLSAVTMGFDPHSTYMSASTLDNFKISMRLELDGIGASLRYVDGFTVVHKIIRGGAADKQGQLKTEDKIVAVGEGIEGEMVDVVDTKLSDVVDLIRGKRGTVVRLGVIPGGEEQPIETYAITRDRIELKDSEARSEVLEVGPSEVIDVGDKAAGTALRIGVINLPSFYMDMADAQVHPDSFKSTTRDVRRLLDSLRQQQVDAVVMDLRGNGGGSLTEAINLTGLFIASGPVVQVKGSDGRVRSHPDEDPSIAWSGPLVVVIDKFSASASEIFAGAIQDYGRGLVVGDHSTHGKGTVQQLFDLGAMLFPSMDDLRSGLLGQSRVAPNYGALKLTIQQFYRPSGDSTQNRGVVADIELPSLTEHWEIGESDLDYALAFDRVEPVSHIQYQLANPSLVKYLRDRSQQRVAASEAFAKELKKIQRYQERKERKRVTLNEEKFLAERAEFNEEKEEEKQLEELTNRDDEVVTRDDYFNEVLAIASDYTNELVKSRIARHSTQPLNVP